MTLLASVARRRRQFEPIAEWLFGESAAPYYTTAGDLPLVDTVDPTTTAQIGTKGAVNLATNKSLYIPAGDTGRLHIGGRGNSVTVACWVNASAVSSQFFVAGIWQEDGADPKRQYGVFGSLPGLSMPSRSCFHVSRLGGASPGWVYSYDASGNPTPLAIANVWQFYVGTYDGTYARSYMNGVFTEDTSVFTPLATSQRNPYHYPDGLNTVGGAFTVGAITGPNPATDSRSFLTGKLAHLRVWERALPPEQVAALWGSERGNYAV